MWFIGVEVGQETSAPPPETNPGSAPVLLSAFTYMQNACFEMFKRYQTNCQRALTIKMFLVILKGIT